MSQAASIPYASQADFLAAAQALLPPGDAWALEEDALLTALLNARAASAARVHERVADLTEAEQFPWMAVDLLPDWEAAYGLPDPCTPLNATIAQRQAAVAAKVASTGGQSPAYFEQVAAALGWTVTVTEFTPTRFGALFGTPFRGQQWQWTWQVNAPMIVAIPARFGEAYFGQLFVAESSSQLECVLNRLKPSHTVLLMNYGD